ncbi:MAG: radical SAM protein [Bdellovibrionales bacterium]|nr:radical SAM protein [Bdellovibrionales bacterium]
MASEQPKVLLITTPSTSLYTKKAFLDINMGTAFVGGGLEASGFDVDFFDFNMALNRIRKASFFSLADNQILSEEGRLKARIHGGWRQPESDLSTWIETLIGEIPNRNYQYIGLSLDRIGYSSIYSKGALHFAILFASALKESFTIPIFLGGRQCINQVGTSYLSHLRTELGSLDPIDHYFEKNGHTTFPQVLKRLEDGEDLHSDAISRLIQERSYFSKMKDILPKYDIKNSKDAYVDMESLFPSSFLEKNREVRDFPEIFIVPYKFSVGCPFTCAFCSDGLEKHHSAWEVEQIVSNLVQLQKRGLRYFRFYNNNINLNKKFIDDFYEAAKGWRLDIRFSDSANFRIFNDDIAKKIKDSGCVKLWYGAETVSEKIQEMIHKRVSLGRIRNHLQTANQLNIWNSLNFIFNFPHETEADFQALLEFLSDRNLVDTFYRNEFLLLHETEYATHPEKFNIRVREIAENGLLGSFDEIGGRTWEELQVIGQNKQDQIDAILPFEKNMLLANDQILFVLHEIYGDKNMIRKKYDCLFECFDSPQEFRDFSYARSWRIPPELDGKIVNTSEVRHNEIGKGATQFAQVFSQM